METENEPLPNKKMEQSIVGISVKIANAAQMLRNTKELTASLETVFIEAQRELEQLYVDLDTAE